MVGANIAYLSLAISAIFGSIFWIMIFLETYRHFPKMEKYKGQTHDDEHQAGHHSGYDDNCVNPCRAFHCAEFHLHPVKRLLA